jgi:hypothetical protein
MRHSVLLLSIVLVAGFVAGCAMARERAPVAPSVDVTGTWRGFWTYGSFSGAVTLTLQQTGSNVTGEVMVGGNSSNSGAIVGTVSGTDFSYRRRSGFTVTAYLIVNGDEMTGTGWTGARLTLRRQK